MSEKLLFSSVDEVHSLYKKKELSPVEVLEAVFERLEELEPMLNAFITTLPEEAREQAKKAEDLFSKGEPTGKLTGIPVSVKDIFMTAGIRTTMGSRIMKDHVPDYNAYVYTALKSSGAVVFGKNSMLEFAYGFVHPDYGQCNNPWDTNRTAGGSSSGSASSVAAGIGYASIGTDTGGSIRIPASFCGIVGLKPTYEAVSREGCFPLSHTLDHVGPLTRTVRDNAAIMEILAPTIPLSESAKSRLGRQRLRSEMRSHRLLECGCATFRSRASGSLQQCWRMRRRRDAKPAHTVLRSTPAIASSTARTAAVSCAP